MTRNPKNGARSVPRLEVKATKQVVTEELDYWQNYTQSLQRSKILVKHRERIGEVPLFQSLQRPSNHHPDGFISDRVRGFGNDPANMHQTGKPNGDGQRQPMPELRAGIVANIDKATVKRIKSGAYPIDATIDLHGFTIESALYELQKFLRQSRQFNYRLVLVITGKGKNSGGSDLFGAVEDETDPLPWQAAGVLHKELPQWLNLPELRIEIIWFCQAMPKHGGSGAWYILLKK